MNLVNLQTVDNPLASRRPLHKEHFQLRVIVKNFWVCAPSIVLNNFQWALKSEHKMTSSFKLDQSSKSSLAPHGVVFCSWLLQPVWHVYQNNRRTITTCTICCNGHERQPFHCTRHEDTTVCKSNLATLHNPHPASFGFASNITDTPVNSTIVDQADPALQSLLSDLLETQHELADLLQDYDTAVPNHGPTLNLTAPSDELKQHEFMLSDDALSDESHSSDDNDNHPVQIACCWSGWWSTLWYWWFSGSWY